MCFTAFLSFVQIPVGGAFANSFRLSMASGVIRGECDANPADVL